MAGELLTLATNVWRDNVELEQISEASLIGHVRLNDAHAGVNVDGRLVLVVPHRCDENLLPVLRRELQQLAGELGLSLVAIAAAQPAPPLLPSAPDGRTLEELLEDLAEVPSELLEQHTRARGSFTLEIPKHDRLKDYAELVAAIENGMWRVAAAIDDAKASR